MFEPRTYRKFMTASDLETFEVRVEETDLQIAAERDLSGAALSAIHRIRGMLEHFLEGHPKFGTTLDPFPECNRSWPREIQAMIRAGRAAGTGPMSAVAGCVAEYVGKALLGETEQVIVENGGDLFLVSNVERTLAIYAGDDNPLSMQRGLRIRPELTPLGICTSSGTVGHSLSLGLADAAVVLAEDTALADAVATSTGNMVARREDVDPALDWALSVPGVLGCAVVLGETLGARGDGIDLVEL
ncbi:MAG: UPF0280 family protein [Planctomycetota bacterium]